MLRTSIALTCLLIVISCSQLNTNIQNIGRHSAYPESVAMVRELPDNTWVTLTGKIVRSLGDNLYLFQDSSDEIKVEITNKAWKSVTFNPETKVKITGKVDLNLGGIQLNVDQVEQLAN